MGEGQFCWLARLARKQNLTPAILCLKINRQCFRYIFARHNCAENLLVSALMGLLQRCDGLCTQPRLEIACYPTVLPLELHLQSILFLNPSCARTVNNTVVKFAAVHVYV